MTLTFGTDLGTTARTRSVWRVTGPEPTIFVTFTTAPAARCDTGVISSDGTTTYFVIRPTRVTVSFMLRIVPRIAPARILPMA